MQRMTLALLAAMAVLLGPACGDSEESQRPGATDLTPATTSADATAAPRRPAGPSSLCLMGGEGLAAQNLEVTARWKGKDRVVIEGSADLPGPGSVNYWICQDGELTASVVWAQQPTFEDGKIRAESKLVEAEVGPVFDPDAHFEVILSVLGEPIQVPYFVIRVPVEGRPE